MKPTTLFSTWRQDLPASIVVFLVAMPLCLGIALASGAPLISGIIAGVVGGLVVGLFSGSPLGVSGPAAGLTAIILVATQELGGFDLLLTAVIMAGALQVVLGFLRAGVIAYYFPNSVIYGMLAGIGVLITLTQIPHGLGLTGGVGSASSTAALLGLITPGAVVITAASLLLLVLWEKPVIKHHKWLGAIPGSMLAVAMGIGLAALFSRIPALAIHSSLFVDLPDLHSLGALPRPSMEGLWNPVVWRTAFVIAMVASLETLLCVEATDKLDPHRRLTPANRELHAQGIGNMVSGFLGGLPVTQVIVRSSANIQSGGQSKLSTMLHGVLILGAVLAFSGLLKMVPLASLAAILFTVGWKLIKPKQFATLWKQGAMRFVPFVITVVGVAFLDLLTGVGLGMAVAVVHILWKNYQVPFHFDRGSHRPGEPIRIVLSEDVTFLNKASIKRTLAKLPPGARVAFDASRTVDLDPDVEEIIQEFQQEAPKRGIEVEWNGAVARRPRHTKVLFHLVIRTAARSITPATP